MKKQILVLIVGFITCIATAQEAASANVLVTDFEDTPIGGAQIQFLNTEEGVVIEGVASNEGTFVVDLPAGAYNIRLKSVGKTKDYSTIVIPELGANEVYNNVNIVIQYEEEQSFTLSDLHFETAKAIIKQSSFKELDELVAYLKLKPNLKIEVGGHTDSDGASNDNLTLSQQRAEAVRAYLIKKGVSGSRIVAKGYGEAKPIAENNTDAGKALNRRTEINIIE